MTKARRQGTAAARNDLTDGEVESYLRSNPDYLCRNPDLIGALEIPARDLGGDANVVDLQSHMLDHLRAQVHLLQQRHDDLLEVSRCRLQTQNRIHAAAFILLSARSLPHLIEIVTTDLAVLMDMDVAALCVESTEMPRVTSDGVRLLPRGFLEELMGDRDVLLDENTSGDRRIYGSATGLVQAQVLLRLRVRSEPPDALLALGARTSNRIHTGQATEALGFLARILEHSIRNWLDLPG